jgi:hypothetical protein
MSNRDVAMKRLAALDPARRAHIDADAAEALLARVLAAAKAPEASRPPLRRRRPKTVIGLAALVLLLLTAAALAASGILTGSPVRPAHRLSPAAEAGVPLKGGSTLLGLSVPDPAGGLPWGMRLVHTTRDLVCIQIGRLYDGELGILGRDGSFGDDERFHPLSPDVVGASEGPRSGPRGVGFCQDPGGTLSFESAAVPESANAGTPFEKTLAIGQGRWISFGLLGPEAQSITYRFKGRSHTVAVQPGTGAYLVVLPSRGSGEVSEPTAGGVVSPTGGLVGPQGAVTEITYRVDGVTCEKRQRGSNTCPMTNGPGLPGPPRRLHRAIHVSLQRSANGHEWGVVTFTAPYAVTSALSAYSIVTPSPCGGGASGTTIEHDVRAGEVVHARLNYVPTYTDRCGRPVKLRVIYDVSTRRVGPATFSGRGGVIVGEATIKGPK